MALDLCRFWRQWGIRVGIVDLKRGSDDLRPMFESMDIPIVECHIGHKGYLRYLKLVWNSWRICRTWQPAAVLCMPFGLHTFVSIGAQVAGVPRVCVHIGNPPITAHRSSAIKSRLIELIGRASVYRLICCSRYVRDLTLENLHVPLHAMTVVYNGAPFEQFDQVSRLKSKENREEGSWVIGMVGTLEAHKDQETLVRAAGILHRRGLDLSVLLIGEGTRRPILEALISAEHAPVELLGSRSDIPDLLHTMDIFVFSTTCHEGLGIALLEAMAAGVPVIASDVPACREVLDDGALGVLVPAGDGTAFADAIERVLSDPQGARRRAAAARQIVRERFSAASMARQYAEVLGLAAPEHSFSAAG